MSNSEHIFASGEGRSLKQAFLMSLWLIAWILIKIGQVPIRLLLFAFLVLKVAFKESISKKEVQPITKHPVVTIPSKLSKSPSLGFLLTMNLLRKKRGRPRTQAFIPFYHNKFKKLINTFFPKPLRMAFALTVVISFIVGYSYVLIVIAHDLPSPERLTDLKEPLTTKFYARDGTLLYQAYEGRNRTLVNLDELPPYLVKATIAIEDKHFYSHPGVDLFAILRAVVANSRSEDLQGGSTITQQLIKNTLLTPERTFERKAKEVLLAYWAERIFTKDQILKMYFNEAPYGGTAWGIEAASEMYFNKKARDLTLAEATLLAGLPASPTEYSPFGANPKLAKERQKKVLDRMVEDNYISRSQADAAYAEELQFNRQQNVLKAAHFVMYVRQYLSNKYGEKVVSQGGLKVITTLDLQIQQMAEDAVAEEVARLAPLNVSNGAAMITDAKTGQILAMVGSKDYYEPKIGNFNVTLASRQPGSSIKPVTYTEAFKQGYLPGNILLDTPVAFRNQWESYAPVNYDGKFHGPVTIRTALGSSYNVPAVKMLAIVGLPNMLKTAKDLGITTLNDPNRYGLSLTLGGGEVKMIDMMGVYGTFSQLGMKYEPIGVLKVVDSQGVVIEDNENRPGVKVLREGIAYLITDILSDNNARTPAFGPNSLLNLPGRTVAVKTGTTDNKRDNWTFGYTPDFVIGVWVGNNDNSPMNPQLTSGVTGATPIWNKLMLNLLDGRENVAFRRPGDVIDGIVDGRRELVLSGQASKSVVGMGKKKVKDEATKEEKEVITFTDPFNTFTSDQTGVLKKP